MNREKLKAELSQLLGNAEFPWAVCGGFALDIFLKKDTRMHGDVDICVFEKDREAVLRNALRDEWSVYEFRGNGKVRPLDENSVSETGRNLMCVKDGCEVVKFYPCEEEHLRYYMFFHTGISEINYMEFLFNRAEDNRFIFGKGEITREIEKAILTENGIPYLAPEIVLLYKASAADNPEYRQDFENAFPCLNEEQRAWFLKGLSVLYPDGHEWNR